ncbi:hypothetical protein Barb6XT_01749 [Bacteroidales bacterium Barb6XT]|nr:hypothetical protein Barb6XT_01749 [Bacteroidales bacterium Barb6XT]
MRNMKNKESRIKIALAMLFISCLLDLPYGYYLLVRFFGMIVFSILAYNQYQKNQMLFIVWAASAVLVNPFFKIALGRGLWNIVDIVWAVLLIYSLFMKKQQENL